MLSWVQLIFSCAKNLKDSTLKYGNTLLKYIIGVFFSSNGLNFSLDIPDDLQDKNLLERLF